MMHRLFAPASVALVGASADPRKLAGLPPRVLRSAGFQGSVYAVNPSSQEILGWPCYPSVSALPEAPDVALVVVPVRAALGVLEECAARGVRFVVLITGGFGEGASGEEGLQRKRRLQAICASSGMRVVGPNTIGMMSWLHNLPLTFASWYRTETDLRGGVAVLTHSGTVGGILLNLLRANHVGVNYWVGLGNEADLEIADFLGHFAEDPAVHTVVCFMEGVKNGRHFLEAATKVRAAGKNVVVLKAGRTTAAQRATRSHTGKLSSSAQVYSSVLRQLGVAEATSLQEAVYTVKLLATTREKPLSGPNLGVIAASGGACSVVVDHAVANGLTVPELSPEQQRQLSMVIPEYGAANNPIDVSADVGSRREILYHTLDTIKHDRSIDTWIVFGRSLIDKFYTDLGPFARETEATVIICPGVSEPPEIEESLQSAGAPVLTDPELCVRALAAVNRAARGRGAAIAKEETRSRWAGAWRTPSPDRIAGTKRVDQALLAHGVPVARSLFASSLEDLQEQMRSQKIDYPVAVKVLSSAIPHKTDSGCVVLNVQDDQALLAAAALVMERGAAIAGKEAVEGVQVQKMAERGREMLVTITSDKDFGPLLVLGMGGVEIEILKDTVVRALPVSPEEIGQMVQELRAYPLLTGFRGEAPRDVDALVELVARVADFYLAEQWVAEVELNPVIVGARGKGAVVVDALVTECR